MKTATDPRHLKRIKTVKNLFSWGFQPTKISDETGKLLIPYLNKIDQEITNAAPEWPLEQINRVDLAILRLAIYELTIDKKEPEKVIIDEAVEIAKSFGGEKSPKFVNGVLGTILNNYQDTK